MFKLISNKIRCKFCGDIIQSNSVHDFRRCKCGKCSTDGGLEYVQRSFDGENGSDVFEDLSQYLEVETGRIVNAKDMKPEDIAPPATDEVTEAKAEPSMSEKRKEARAARFEKREESRAKVKELKEEGMSNEEVSEVLDIPESSVRYLQEEE